MVTIQDITQEYSRCPRDIACKTMPVFRAKDEQLYVFTKNGLQPHICNTKGSSKKPDEAWMALWFSKTTYLYRWSGPFRERKSAELPPAQGGKYGRGNNRKEQWKLVTLFRSDLDWEEVKTDKP